MTGVNIAQWRGNIGLFDRKNISKKHLGKYKDNKGLIIMYHICKILRLLSKTFEILFCVLLLFSYCMLIVVSLPIFSMGHLYLDILKHTVVPHLFPFQFNKFVLYQVHAFCEVNLIPKIISYSARYSISLFNENISTNMKNHIFFITVLQILLVLSGLEVNPGPVNSKKSYLSFAVWNLDSIPARDFARIPLIETFQATYDFDIFGVCESLLNKNIHNDDIFISGFSPDPFRVDKPDNIRNGGVCLYFKENLPIKQRGDLELLPETIVAEIKLNKKKIFFVLSYCHPNLSSTEFDEYVKSLEIIYENINKENPAVTIITGDFNARSPLFWEYDIENREGRVFSNFLMSNNLEELINEPTHTREDVHKPV